MKIAVFMKPNSSKGPLVEASDRGLTMYVRQPAHQGQANQAAIDLLAAHFEVAPSRVRLKSGHGSKYKLFEIDLPDEQK